jgi:hypothetical protein
MVTIGMHLGASQTHTTVSGFQDVKLWYEIDVSLNA